MHWNEHDIFVRDFAKLLLATPVPEPGLKKNVPMTQRYQSRLTLLRNCQVIFFFQSPILTFCQQMTAFNSISSLSLASASPPLRSPSSRVSGIVHHRPTNIPLLSFVGSFFSLWMSDNDINTKLSKEDERLLSMSSENAFQSFQTTVMMNGKVGQGRRRGMGWGKSATELCVQHSPPYLSHASKSFCSCEYLILQPFGRLLSVAPTSFYEFDIFDSHCSSRPAVTLFCAVMNLGDAAMNH